MGKRNLVRIVVVIAAVAVFAGQRFWMHRGTHEARAVVSRAGAVIEPVAGTRGFKLGSLTFAPCELAREHSGETTAAFCAPFSVPEDRDKPHGRTIALRLALIRSSAEAPARDLVVYLAGGPGQSAVDTWPQVAGGFAPLLRHRNVLLLDQRGTGGSHALKCAGEATDAAAAAAAEPDPARIRSATRACLDTLEKDSDPAAYTTTAAVADLEAVRQALGAPEFDLVGVSYGTRVAQQYLMRHADAVRSAVLDSAAPNELALGAEFASALEQSLKAQFADCTNTPACAKAFGDPYARLYRLRDALKANPVTVELRDPRTFVVEKKPLDAATLIGIVRLFAYTPETAALLPLLIDRASKGDYAPLLAQANLIEEGVGDLATSALQLSVICSEDADLIGDRSADKSLLLGDTLTADLAARCTLWPRAPRPADFHKPIASDTPVLVLSGEFDPVTPPRYGAAIVKGLPNGRQLVAKGQGHGIMARGCLPGLVEKFVDTLDAKALDVHCVEQLGPTPAFIDYNGAAP